MANVATPSNIQNEMLQRAELIRTLMGGTRAMRRAGPKYLPKFTAEKQDSYRSRIDRSPLFNALGKTVRDLTGRVFRQPIVLKDDVPKELRELAENIDLTGRHLNVFARDVFFDAMQTGIGYILVDAPIAEPQEGPRPRTLTETNAAGIRPYLIYIPLERLISWKSESIRGVETLVQVRIREFVTEPDGEWEETRIEQIRVIEPSNWRLYRRKEAAGDTNSDDWVLHEEGVNNLGKIALVPVYLNRTGFMTGAPPLAELADLNLAHWQSSSDQRNILHVSRVPILVGTGFEEADQIEVGASSMVRTTNPDAKLAYVEHSGKAIGAGREELKDIEFQMQAMGLQLLTHQPGQTATGEIRDDSKEKSSLAMMALALGDALEQALGFMGEFANLGEDAGGSVDVNTDFGTVGAVDTQTLLAAVNSDQISRTTFWNELKRRNVLSDDFDPEVERDRLDSQASSRSMNLDN